MKKKVLKWMVIITVILVTAVAVDFLIWRNRQIKRLESGSRLVKTAHGVVEYTVVGNGPAVLVLHGTLGGYDQAQILAQMLDVSTGKFLFVSRPGYLRTPLATGVTFEEQADAYASLLDELGIDQVAVIATSGGGPSALQFALRYPDRCWGMVLIAANSDANAGKSAEAETAGTTRPPVWLTNMLLSDLMSWLIVRTSQCMTGKVLTAMVGADYAQVVMNDPDKYTSFVAFVDSIALLSQRRDGALNDGAQFLAFIDHPFERITSPTLILYGTKDTFVPLAEQTCLSKTLPNSEYIEIEGGTHFMAISHGDVLAPLLTDFLNTHAPKK